MRKYVEQLGGVYNWKNRASDREARRLGHETGWSLKAQKTQKEEEHYVFEQTIIISNTSLGLRLVYLFWNLINSLKYSH